MSDTFQSYIKIDNKVSVEILDASLHAFRIVDVHDFGKWWPYDYSEWGNQFQEPASTIWQEQSHKSTGNPNFTMKTVLW